MTGPAINYSGGAAPVTGSATCPTGSLLVGGGVSLSHPEWVDVESTYPSPDPHQGTWTVVVYPSSRWTGAAITGTPYAMCMS